jgi:UTP-glucose-1-phosphate uridylyltransferase
MYECEGLSSYEKYAQSIYLVQKYLDEQLSPYGILTNFSNLNYIVSTRIKKKTLKKLGRTALRKGRYLFLKDVVIWSYNNCSDMREIQFKEFDLEKYRLDRYIRPSGANWYEYPC